MADLDALLKQQEQLKNRIQKQQSLERKKRRKLDTRRKILLGGAIIKAAREGLLSTDQLNWFVEQLSERDQKLFPNEWITKQGGEDDGVER